MCDDPDPKNDLEMPPPHQGSLKREMGVWVFHCGVPLEESASELIDRDREERMRELDPQVIEPLRGVD